MSGRASAEVMTGVREQGKGTHVRQVFENTSRYLKSRRVDICFRVETVKAYAAPLGAARILDIGCGDGTISLQLLTPESRLTLMDLSSSMIETATRNIPFGLAGNVKTRNENFATAVFPPEPYDLVIAVGVMAHVDSPGQFLRKINGLLPPGGHLILEFTDAYHPVGRIGRMWGWLKERIAPAKYPTNKLSFRKVSEVIRQSGFAIENTFRYSRVPLPGFNRFISHAMEYRMMRSFFGDCRRNSNAWLGNEYIFLLRSDNPS